VTAATYSSVNGGSHLAALRQGTPEPANAAAEQAGYGSLQVRFDQRFSEQGAVDVAARLDDRDALAGKPFAFPPTPLPARRHSRPRRRLCVSLCRMRIARRISVCDTVPMHWVPAPGRSSACRRSEMAKSRKTAREIGAAAIFVGRRGRGRLSGVPVGSVSQKLASLAPCMVVIVP
jgi:hypothetical protein